MLNLPIKPAKGRAKRHNKYPITGYFDPSELPKVERLARFYNYSHSELLRALVNQADAELDKKQSDKPREKGKPAA